MTATDDADNAARQVATDLLPPGAVEDFPIRRRDVSKHGDGKGDHQFRDGSPVDAAGPAESLALFAHGVEIDHVESDSVFGDDLKLRQLGQRRCVYNFQCGDGFVMPFQILDQSVAF